MGKLSKSPTAKGIFKKREEYNFDNPVQRGHVWNNDKRSLLIHSMLEDYPIPPVYAEEGEGEIMHILDGKQRLTTIIRFLGDEFALSPNTPDFEGKNIAGLKFSELEEDLQDKIKDYVILIYYYRTMTIEKRDEMFLRLNGGKPMSKIELVRVEAGQEFMEYVRDLAKNTFFQNCNISDSGRAKFTDEEILLQCILMAVEDGGNGLNGSALSETVKILKKTHLNEFEQRNIQETIEYLNIAFVEKVKFLKKVNIPVIFYTALHNREELSATDFAYAMQEFFKSPTEEYKDACSSGSAKAENVAVRVEELQAYIDSKQAKKEDKEQWEEEGEEVTEQEQQEEITEAKENAA